MVRIGAVSLAFVLVASGAQATPGGACGDMVARFDAYLRSHPEATGALPQTVGAQVDRQPTRDSVAKAQAEGRAHLYDLLNKAKAQEKAGDEKGCRQTLVEVEWMITP